MVKKNRDSVLFKEGRNSIIKTNKAITIYFGDEPKDQDEGRSDAKADESVKNNIKQWKNMQVKMDSFREAAQAEELKVIKKKSGENDSEAKEMLRNQINQLLSKAKKI